MDIKGKKAIVTGGGSGYGKGIAAALAGAGAKVWITGRNAAKIEAAAQEIGARPFVADVSVPGDWDRLFAVDPACDEIRLFHLSSSVPCICLIRRSVR